MVDDDIARLNRYIRETHHSLEAAKWQIELVAEAASDLYRDVGGAAANDGAKQMFSEWFEDLDAAMNLAERAEGHMTDVGVSAWRLLPWT